MSEIFPFFLILLAGLVFSQVFNRLHVPWTITLIISGIIIGPFGFSLITPDPTLSFLKYLGLVFLMFMAGLETKMSGFKQVWKESSFIGFITGLIPFLVGTSIGVFFDYSISTALFLGIIFTSSSIAIAIPVLESKGLIHSRIGKVITSSIILQDAASLVFLAIILQYILPGTLPFPIFVTLFIVTLFLIILFRWIIPRLRWFFEHRAKTTDLFERDLRIIFAVLVGTVIIFEVLGLHAIVGAFLAGLILSELIKEETIKQKIHVMGYGLFIPVFFVMIGVDTNINAFLEAQNIAMLALVVVLGSMIAKFFSGFLSAKIMGFTNKQSSLVGGTCIPQLSTTLAVIAVGQQYNLLPEELVTTLVILSIVTVFVSPIIVGGLAEKVKKDYFVTKEEK